MRAGLAALSLLFWRFALPISPPWRGSASHSSSVIRATRTLPRSPIPPTMQTAVTEMFKQGIL